MIPWVIRYLLNEEHVLILQREKLLDDFAICSKDVIIEQVIEYINSEDSSSQLVEFLSNSFKDRIEFLNVQTDEGIIKNISKVYEYSYSSIHAGLTIDQLLEIKEDIISVSNEKHNTPYVPTINKDIIANIINNLLALYRVNLNGEYKRLAHILTKNKELFKDKNNSPSKGTIFKLVAKKSTELDIILKGIDFLIEQKTNKRQPEAWRLF